MTNSEGSLSTIGEFGLIAELASKVPSKDKDVYLGIGDDAAAIDIGEDRLLLATCDIQIEDIHFTIHGFTPEQIGRKAAAVNLSDIAAMGGAPRFALVSIAVPSSMEAEYITRVYKGLGDCLSQWGASVIGGNTARSTSGLIIDITVLGEVQRSQILTRKGARQGDALCVTGDLGASRAGLMLLSNADIAVSKTAEEEALTRHRTPTPRLAEIRIPVVLNAITACIDISDGLLGDAMHLAKESHMQVRINAEHVPVAACVREVARITGDNPLHIALQGGEDFELLFTLQKDRVEAVRTEIFAKTGTSVKEIGEIVEGAGVLVLQGDGSPLSLAGGFDHFR